MASAAGRTNTRILVQFITVTAIWGSTWMVIRGQLGVVPPSWSVAYRFMLAGAVMLGLCLVTRQPLRLGARGHLFALVVGLMQFVLNFNLVYRAEQHLTSGLVSLLFALLIVPNALLGWLVLGQRVTARFALGSLIGIAGLVLLFGRDLALPGQGAEVALGITLSLAGVMCASVGNVLQATPTGRALPIEPMLAVSMLYGAAMNGAYAWATAGAPVFDARPVYVAGVVYLGVIASALAFRLYYSLLRAIGPAKAAYTGVLIPVLAMLLSTLFEGYVWTPTGWAGVALALTGLAVALRGRDVTAPAAAAEAEAH